MATVQVDPMIIYYTHSKLRATFSGCSKTLEETLQEILAGTTKVEDIPLIHVMYSGKQGVIGSGKYISQNNRRLWVYKQLAERGFLKTIPVTIIHIKPDSKHATQTYSLKAKITMK